jgi:hypothetical protein
VCSLGVGDQCKTSPWFLVPCLAMLTYGWVFYMGFFNFYLAAGLSCGRWL